MVRARLMGEIGWPNGGVPRTSQVVAGVLPDLEIKGA
jgi:hypothetical protein